MLGHHVTYQVLRLPLVAFKKHRSDSQFEVMLKQVSLGQFSSIRTEEDSMRTLFAESCHEFINDLLLHICFIASLFFIALLSSLLVKM